MERNGPSKWNWIICNLPLKQIINGENVTWSLQPSITLSHPTGEGPDPQIKVLLDQEKSFQCTEELGWNWHKSWKLPTISLQLEITDSDKGDALLCPKDIYVHIFAVKALVDSNSKLCLVDVGLRGTNKMELVDGKAIFQTLKFASTSYNNEGVKFHLLMCIYLQISEDTKPKILKAVISPPIFVDSRKSVRENDKMNENKLFLYVEPFYPDNFTRKFVKKETKKKESIEEEIQNSVDGLHSYLTAPNIRNKVKHPIFLCVRFSNCITLFMNPELVREEDKDNLVEFFQGLLFEEIEKGQEGGEAKLQDSFFILYINKNDLEDKLKKKKILELLCPIKCRSLSVVFNRAEVPPSFIPLQDLRGLMELYSKSYSKLLSKSKFCLRGEEENEDEEGPSDRIPPPERQMISFANDTAPRTQNDWNKYFDTSSYEEDSQKRMKNEESANAPMSMMEARTISYRDSMSKLFPNGQDPLNSTLSTPSNNSMQNFQLGANSQLLRSIFQGKGAVETPPPVSQFPRSHVGSSPLSNMNPALVNQNGGRFPMARAPQSFGNMDPLSLMMMNNKRGQFPNMNLMGSLGQMGQQIGGMANFQQMMMGKEGDLGNNNPERMQAMMQAYQQFQMMQGQGDGGIKAENLGENWNGGDIHVKIQDDDDDSRNRRGPGNGKQKRNDINVKDEDNMN